MKLIATTAALALGSLLMLAPNTSHADSWHVSLNLAPQPVLAYAQPTIAYYTPQPVQIVQPRPVVIQPPYQVSYYTPRPVIVKHPHWRGHQKWHH